MWMCDYVIGNATDIPRLLGAVHRSVMHLSHPNHGQTTLFKMEIICE